MGQYCNAAVLSAQWKKKTGTYTVAHAKLSAAQARLRVERLLRPSDDVKFTDLS